MRMSAARLSLMVSAGLLGLMAYAALQSLQFRVVSMWFPLFTALGGALLCLVAVLTDVADVRRENRAAARVPAPESVSEPVVLHTASISGANPGQVDLDQAAAAQAVTAAAPAEPTDSEADDHEELDASVFRGFAKQMLWFGTFPTALVLFGAPLAIVVWLSAFMRIQVKEPITRIVLTVVIATVVVVSFTAAFGLALPTGELIPSGRLIPRWSF